LKIGFTSFAVLLSLTIHSLFIPQSALGAKNQKRIQLEQLPLELKMFIFDQLKNLDETSLLNLGKTSFALNQEIRGWGYHSELVEIESFEQLERNYPPNSKLMNVKFVTQTISKDEIQKCLFDPRLELTEKVDVENVITLTAEERLEIQNRSFTLSTPSQVLSASFSPDGTKIITTSFDGAARIWETQTWTLLHTLTGHTHAVLSASFSPDGTKIVTASTDRTARIWNVETGEALHTLVGHTATVRTATFSPDGHQIVTSSNDRTARVWNAETGENKCAYVRHSGLRRASFSPDGKKLLTVSYLRTAEVWDLITETRLLSLIGHFSNITSASYSPDGTKIITSSDDSTVLTWNALTGELIQILSGQNYRVLSAVFSTDGSKIVTSSLDFDLESRAQVWDSKTGELIYSTPAQLHRILWAAFSPNTHKIITVAAHDENTRIWNLKKELREYQGRMNHVEDSGFSTAAKIMGLTAVLFLATYLY
jgi:WD40 repeat protein